MEIEIPKAMTEPLLTSAAEQEISAEEVVERAIRKYIERNDENAVWRKERNYS